MNRTAANLNILGNSLDPRIVRGFMLEGARS